MNKPSSPAADLATLRGRFGTREITTDHGSWGVVDTASAGSVVLLLPGVQGGGEIFYKVLFRLGGQHRLVALTYPPVDTVAGLARGLVQVLDVLKHDRADLIGSSLGGLVAQFVAAESPERVRAVLLGNSFVDIGAIRHLPAFDSDVIAATAPVLLHQQRMNRIRTIEDCELREALLELVGAQRPGHLSANALAVACAPAAPLIGESVEVTLLSCRDDPTVPEPMRAALEHRYPRARTVRLDRGGHYPHVTATEDYAEALAGFLRR